MLSYDEQQSLTWSLPGKDALKGLFQQRVCHLVRGTDTDSIISIYLHREEVSSSDCCPFYEGPQGYRYLLWIL